MSSIMNSMFISLTQDIIFAFLTFAFILILSHQTVSFMPKLDNNSRIVLDLVEPSFPEVRLQYVYVHAVSHNDVDIMIVISPQSFDHFIEEV